MMRALQKLQTEAVSLNKTQCHAVLKRIENFIIDQNSKITQTAQLYINADSVFTVRISLPYVKQTFLTLSILQVQQADMETGHPTVVTQKGHLRILLQYITGMTIQDCYLNVHYMYTVSSKNLSSKSRGHGLKLCPTSFYI